MAAPRRSSLRPSSHHNRDGADGRRKPATPHRWPDRRKSGILLRRFWGFSSGVDNLARTRVRYGYFRLYILLLREGWPINHKRVYRLYRNDGLSLRLKRPRRHVSAVNRKRSAEASAPNALWSMDFVSDALFDGRRLRALTVVDAYTREALMIEVDSGIKGEQVVEAMSRITTVRRAPKSIRVDNGPEFVSKALDRRAYDNGVTLDFSRPGKPTDNAFIELFNGRLRDECLNVQCSCRWPTPGPRSRPGGSTTTKAVLTCRLAG